MRRLVIGVMFLLAGAASAAEVVKAGAGSYAPELPERGKKPPREVYKTDAFKGPVPTNDWWSSVAFTAFSNCQYPHPLAVRAEPRGLRVFCPDKVGVGETVGLFAGMPPKGDFVVSAGDDKPYAAAKIDKASDWFVGVEFQSEDGGGRFHASYGHGCPYVYFSGRGDWVITFDEKPTIRLHDRGRSLVAFDVGGRHYAAFAPPKVGKFRGLDGLQWRASGAGSTFLSVAALPDDSPETLALFERHAHAHVADTKVAWTYDPRTSEVVTTFEVVTKREAGDTSDTLFALYPHQWQNGKAELTGHSYPSVRGEMKLARGTSFETRMTFNGVLPALPDVGVDEAKLNALLEREAQRPSPPMKDTYWEGKQIGRLATLIPLAEQAGGDAEAFRTGLKHRLEDFLSADDAGAKSGHWFAYDKLWGTLIGYPDSFGSADELNDHHFHYGYFIKAAAEVARRDRAWAGRWRPMVDLLIRDIASPDRDDKLFPFLRNFDPYAGHSWASGHAKFDDGNNNESSSEAMNAWAGLILWGEAVGDKRIRDLGIYLYTTELHAIEAYWFDVGQRNRPKAYKPPVVTMVWGGKAVHETWFGKRPEQTYTINWLPITGASLYLGRYPQYVRRNLDGMIGEKGSENWAMNADLAWMYEALVDAPAALKKFPTDADAKYPAESGTARPHVYHWIASLEKLGQVDRTVTADHPLHAVFRKGRTRTYVVYNTAPTPTPVTFSDGTALAAAPGGFTVKRREAP